MTEAKKIAELERTITRLRRQAETSRKFWIRAGESALAGDVRELRNRVEMAKLPPEDVVLSNGDDGDSLQDQENRDLTHRLAQGVALTGQP